MNALGRIKKDKKKKKKKAKSGGGLFSAIKNIFGKNKEKKTQKKAAKKQKKQEKQNKKTEKAMAKKQKKVDKQQAKAEKKAAKQQKKADKQQAKAEKKSAKQQAKADKKSAKQTAKQKGNFDLENALTTASMVKDAVAQNVPGADKYLNVQQDNEEYMDNEVNSSGEKNIASANKDEGFISKHKGLLIGGGIVLLAALGAVMIIKSRKSTPTPSTTTPVSGVGYIEPIELS